MVQLIEAILLRCPQLCRSDGDVGGVSVRDEIVDSFKQFPKISNLKKKVTQAT